MKSYEFKNWLNFRTNLIQSYQHSWCVTFHINKICSIATVVIGLWKFLVFRRLFTTILNSPLVPRIEKSKDFESFIWISTIKFIMKRSISVATSMAYYYRTDSFADTVWFLQSAKDYFCGFRTIISSSINHNRFFLLFFDIRQKHRLCSEYFYDWFIEVWNLTNVTFFKEKIIKAS